MSDYYCSQCGARCGMYGHYGTTCNPRCVMIIDKVQHLLPEAKRSDIIRVLGLYNIGEIL
jgi:hypothetical protein